MEKIKIYVLLHILLILYSFSTVFSKIAGQHEFFTKEFICLYGLIIIILGIYAIGWQQVIKRLPLTEAYANKAITVVWGIIWGVTLFSEKITLGKIIGAFFVIVGVLLYSVE